YGQRFLAEAIRAVEAGIEAPLLECVKLLAASRRMPALFPHLPCELCFEGFTESGLQFGLIDGGSAARVGALEVERALLDEVHAERATLERLHPVLFASVYCAATRVLYGALPRAGDNSQAPTTPRQTAAPGDANSPARTP